MLRIYCAMLSTAASRVRMCAEAMGLDYEPTAVALLAAIDPSEAVDVELSTHAALSTWREKLRARPFDCAVHSFYGEGVLEPAAT
jgi:hypothetical protein